MLLFFEWLAICMPMSPRFQMSLSPTDYRHVHSRFSNGSQEQVNLIQPYDSVPSSKRTPTKTCNVSTVHSLFSHVLQEHALWIWIFDKALLSTFHPHFQTMTLTSTRCCTVAEIEASEASFERYLLPESAHDLTYSYLACGNQFNSWFHRQANNSGRFFFVSCQGWIAQHRYPPVI